MWSIQSLVLIKSEFKIPISFPIQTASACSELWFDKKIILYFFVQESVAFKITSLRNYPTSSEINA